MGKEVIISDKRLKKVCEQLRYDVEHPNEFSDISLNQGIYRTRDVEAIRIAKCDGVEIGYKVQSLSESGLLGRYLTDNMTLEKRELDSLMIRKVYVKIPGEDIMAIPKKEKDSLIAAVFDVFIDDQQDIPDITEIARDSFMITQVFMVCTLINSNPNLQSIAGGVNINSQGLII